MRVTWVPTTAAVYSAIRVEHRDGLTVHGTFTDIGGYNGEKRIMTEWGLKGSDAPLIKCDTRGDVNNYFIASVRGDSDD